jgi:DNA-binding NarL/FixJ family response regulator
MTTAVQIVPAKVAVVGPDRARKLRVALADASEEHRKIVLALLDLHERVDLVGRATNLDEVTWLVTNQRADLLVLDLDMHLANLIVPAVVLSSRIQVKIIGLCIDETISFRHLNCITGVNVLTHRSRFQQEFLSVIDKLYRNGNTKPDTQNVKTCSAALARRIRNSRA